MDLDDFADYKIGVDRKGDLYISHCEWTYQIKGVNIYPTSLKGLMVMATEHHMDNHGFSSTGS